jgi:hypothetical protein
MSGKHEAAPKWVPIKQQQPIDLTGEPLKTMGYWFDEKTKSQVAVEYNYTGFDVFGRDVYDQDGEQVLFRDFKYDYSGKIVVEFDGHKFRCNVLKLTNKYGTYDVNPVVGLSNFGYESNLLAAKRISARSRVKKTMDVDVGYDIYAYCGYDPYTRTRWESR